MIEDYLAELGRSLSVDRAVRERVLEEVRAHLGSPTMLERVEFVLFDRRSLEVFEQKLAEMK